jgi:O-antigen ligase
MPRADHCSVASCGRLGPTIAALSAMLWLIYSINGFRPPTTPITLTDGNAGAAIRQVLFLGMATSAMGLLFFTRALGPTLVRHRGFVLLALGMSLSLLYSADAALTARRVAIFACGLTTAIGLVSLPARPMRMMQRTVTLVAGLGAWMSLAWWVALPPEFTINPERPGLSGISNHPNTLAPLLALGFVIGLGWRPEHGGFRLARLVALLGCLIALPMTQSMSSCMLLIVATAAYLILRSATYWRTLILLVAAVVLGTLLTIGLSTLLVGALDAVGRDASFSGRDELWATLLSEGLKKPMFGHGWGSFWYEGRGRELVGTWNPRQAHNAYLDIFLDLGLVGLIACVIRFHLTLVRALITLYAHERSDRGRSTLASFGAVGFALLGVYGFQQSFFLKVDSMPFILLLWIILLLERAESEVATRYDIAASNRLSEKS